jgi:hypothetical protein
MQRAQLISNSNITLPPTIPPTPLDASLIISSS